jgi:hypothetical protein
MMSNLNEHSSPRRTETAMHESSIFKCNEDVHQINMTGISGHSPVSITNYCRFDDHIIEREIHKKSTERLNRAQK